MNRQELEHAVQRLLDEKQSTGIDMRVHNLSEDQKVFANVCVPPCLLQPVHFTGITLDKTPPEWRTTRPSSRIGMVSRAFSNAECAELLQEFARHDFLPIGHIYARTERTSKRLLFRSPALAHTLFQRLCLRNNLYKTMPLVAGVGHWTPRAINPVFKVSRYDEGDEFKRHLDAPWQRRRGECTGMTILIYLSIPKEGGHTQFFDTDQETGLAGRGVFEVAPGIGKAVAFSQDIWHSGQTVKGVIPKVVMRCDVEYHCDFEGTHSKHPSPEMKAINEQYERSLLLRVLNPHPSESEVREFTQLHIDALTRHVALVTQLQHSQALASALPFTTDVLRRTLCFLTLREVLMRCSVSRTWCNCSRDPFWWEKLFLERWPRDNVMGAAVGFSWYHQYAQRHVLETACPVAAIDLVSSGRLSLGYSGTSPATFLRNYPAVWGIRYIRQRYGGHGCFWEEERESLWGVPASYLEDPTPLSCRNWLEDEHTPAILKEMLSSIAPKWFVLIVPLVGSPSTQSITTFQNNMFRESSLCFGIIWMDAAELVLLSLVSNLPVGSNETAIVVIETHDPNATWIHIMRNGSTVSKVCAALDMTVEDDKLLSTLSADLCLSIDRLILCRQGLLSDDPLSDDRAHREKERGGGTPSVVHVDREFALVQGALAVSMIPGFLENVQLRCDMLARKTVFPDTHESVENGKYWLDKAPLEW